MEPKERLSTLEGILVVALEEGAQLGIVTRVMIEPALGKLGGIVFRPHRIGSEMYVPSELIRNIGYDVIMVPARAAAAPFMPGDHPRWRSAHDLQGLWVTALDGHHLGTLVDLGVRPSDWRICELELADARRLPVNPDEITVGDDEILVPSAYAEAIVRSEKTKPGLLARLFGQETIEEVSAALRRGLRPRPAKNPPEKAPGKPQEKQHQVH